MAALKPKIEFFRFKLNHKDEERKTFEDYIVEELGINRPLTDKEAMAKMLDHFISSLIGEYSKDDRLKKELKLIEDKNFNKYLEHRPTYSEKKHLISGVINGGPYDKEGIVSNTLDEKDKKTLGREYSILRFYFFLLYTPLEHDEGCFIIHSNDSEDTITTLFRNYIANIFRGQNYNKANVESYCPISFQNEFRQGAVLQQMSFKKGYIEDYHTDQALKEFFSEYQIKIEAIPKRKGTTMDDLIKVRDYFASMVFGSSKSEKKLANFEENKIVLKDSISKSERTFTFDAREGKFVPVVLLKGRVNKKNPDGTPDFTELKKYCITVLEDEVLPEIRPDLNVTKIK